MILFFLSLLAGVLTVLAPCTITLLPVIVGGSIGGAASRIRRPLIITGTLGLSVIAFTFILKVSTAFIQIPPQVWGYISGIIIIYLGLTLRYPTLWERMPFIGTLNQKANIAVGAGYQKQNLIGDILIGAALGPVFSSCSPTYFLIVAEVLPRSFAEGTIYLLAYAVGLSATLFGVAFAGQSLLLKFSDLSDPKSYFKRTIAWLFVFIGATIFFGYDKKLELIAANNIFDVTKIEQSLLQKTSPEAVAPISPEAIALKSVRYQMAPEITSPSGFINTNGKPITLGEFRGKKVVLIDFWTYSCINCKRTLPYVKAWYEKYKDQGLEIVSIHTPEFSFEKVKENVERAAQEEGLKYPIVMDNDYGTWHAFKNQYWPRKYIIDIDGAIVYDHAGEGDYTETETAIQKALAERSLRLKANMPSSGTVNPNDAVSVSSMQLGSPETYFGAERNEYFGNGDAGKTGEQTLTLPAKSPLNIFNLGGTWEFKPEYAQSISAYATIVYKFHAKDVYMVASSLKGVDCKLFIDDKPIGDFKGDDVDANGNVHILEDRLYKLVHMNDYGTHTLRIEVTGRGLNAYTFTFG